MKFLKLQLLKMAAILLPLIFLCSCYEIVYVSQDADKIPNDILRPDICIQVYLLNEKQVTPYIGMLIPIDWDIKNGFVYSKSHDGYSQIIGSIVYNANLSNKMQKVDPPPKGYSWWVGTGNAPITETGVYNAFPIVYTGSHPGNYAIDYMIGDSENGLNYQRTNKITLNLARETAPIALKTFAEGKDIHLKWIAPSQTHSIIGYSVYRNGVRLNNSKLTETKYVDKDVPYGSYEYSILPLYKGEVKGTKSTASKICYAPCGTSMIFDGKDDKLMVFDDPSLRMKEFITMEAWIKMDRPELLEPRIISKGKNGSGYEMLLTDLKQHKSLEFRLPFGTLKSSTPLLHNQWYHVAAVYNGKLMKLYINGSLDCMMLAHGPMKHNSFPMTIAKSSTSNDFFFGGLIDEVRIWNVARTDAEIKDNFSSKLSPTAKGLVGNWAMSEGCSQVTCDNSAENNNGYLSGSCWAPEPFPFVEDVSNLTNSGLLVPVLNYQKAMKPSKLINLEFKINPNLLKYEGISTKGTQLEGYGIMSSCTKDGVIHITAYNYSGVANQSDVLLYVDVKALQSHLKTSLKFNEFLIDGKRMRVASGEVIAAAIPGIFKTGIGDEQTTSQLLSVYPNPATSFINVGLGELNDQAVISVLNITGQEVYSYTLQPDDSNTIHKIDLIGFSKGIYLINMRYNDQVHVKKIAVN